VAADVRRGFQTASFPPIVGSMKKWIVAPLLLVFVLLATVAATHHHGGSGAHGNDVTDWETSRPHPKSETVFEGKGSEHCGWQDLTFLSWNSRSFVRDVNGKLSKYTPVPVEADATTAPGSTFTGWHDGQRELWTDPRSDKNGPLSIYIVSPDGVERWPAIGLCF
jgi:hypothetical protein